MIPDPCLAQIAVLVLHESSANANPLLSQRSYTASLQG